VTGNWVESGKIMEGALNPSQILQPPPVPSTQYPVPGAAFLPHMPVGDRWGTPRRYLLTNKDASKHRGKNLVRLLEHVMSQKV
jgi:hypothetical protein